MVRVTARLLNNRINGGAIMQSWVVRVDGKIYGEVFSERELIEIKERLENGETEN